MSRSAPSLLLLQAAILLVAQFTCAFCCAAEPKTVELVNASKFDWAQGRREVDAELTASGYEIVRQDSDAEEIGGVLELLTDASSGSGYARVVVLRVDGSGVAYVWMRDSDRTYQVRSETPDTDRAANILSLQVAELIDLGDDVQRPTPTEQEPALPPDTQQSEVRVPRSEVKIWQFLGGAGVTGGSGIRALLPSLELSVGRRLAGAFGFDVSLSGSLPKAQNVSVGALQLGRFRTGLGLSVGTGHTIWWSLVPGLGVQCYTFSRTHSDQSKTRYKPACSADSLLALRSGVRVKDVSVYLAGSISATFRKIRVLSDTGIEATYGRPSWTVAGGLGWQF